MTTKNVKLPQKGAVAKITEIRKGLRNQPASKDLRDVFKKDKDAPAELPEKTIASTPGKRDPDLGL
ncbi:hypothetical protein WDW86_10745 [Bdellovibrionota bacterium FG-2]